MRSMFDQWVVGDTVKIEVNDTNLKVVLLIPVRG